MINKGYIAVGLVILMTMIPAATDADCYYWFGNVYSNGVPVTTDPLPEGAECTITAGIPGDASIWWYNTALDLRADVQYFETVTHQSGAWNLHSPSFLQFGTITPTDQNWGPFMSNHLYTKGGVTGEGLPLTFQIVDWMDGNYGNNYCHIPVTITCACVERCDTAWANWGDSGTCLIPGCSKNWGWYTTASLDELKNGITSDVYAGAGRCDLKKGYYVGTVTVTLNDVTNVVTVDFALEDDYELTGWHVWASDSSLCPHKGFSKWFTGEDEYGEIQLDTPLTDTAGDGVYIAVHSGVCSWE